MLKPIDIQASSANTATNAPKSAENPIIRGAMNANSCVNPASASPTRIAGRRTRRRGTRSAGTDR